MSGAREYSAKNPPAWLWDAALVFALGVLAVWLRWPSLGTDAFHNEDVAGITYNADMLRRGLLPLVDNLELKAPGSFYLSWVSWELFGRSLSVLQKVGCAWSVLGTVAMYVAGRTLWGGLAPGFLAGLIFTLLAPVSDSMDVNYNAWMAAPYAGATALFIVWLKGGRDRWLIACGVVLAIAGLMKRQSAFLFPTVFIVIWLAPRLRRPHGWAPARPPLRSTGMLFAGLAGGFAPAQLYYTLRGEPVAFISHYFFSKGGWRYLKGELTFMEKLVRVGDGVLGFWAFMAIPTVLAVGTLVLLLIRRRKLNVVGVFLGLHLLFSFMGASVGFRYFKSYYIQTLPAAALIAAHPAGALLHFLRGDTWRTAWAKTGWRRVVTPVLAIVSLSFLVPAIRHDLREIKRTQVRRSKPRDGHTRAVAKIVRENTEPTDTIWVWGRWGWPIYYHADRASASRVVKTLAVITSNLTNTWRRPTKPTVFVPVGPYEEVVEELRANQPAFIVLSKNERYRGYTGFEQLLRERYRGVPHFRSRNFDLRVRKDFELRKPPKPRKRKAKRKPKTRTKARRPTPKQTPKAPRPPPPKTRPAPPAK